MYQCANKLCLDNDPRNVAHVLTHDTHEPYLFKCRICGFESDTNPVDRSQYPSYERPPRSGKSYRRRSHVIERLSLHLENGPDVPASGYRIIEKYFLSDHYQARHAGRKLGKTDIRELLRFIDAEERRRTGTNPRFTNLYLENFKQIIHHLVQGVSHGTWDTSQFDATEAAIDKFKVQQALFKTMTPMNIMRVGRVFQIFSDIWDTWQRSDVPSERRFPERKHFPNFNMTFHRCFRILQIDDTQVDYAEFPAPKSKKSCEQVTFYLNELEAHAFTSGLLIKQETL